MPSLLELNRDILAALHNLAFSACCPDLPLTDPPTHDTDIEPGVGDPPSHWGDEEVADWEDWELLLCGAANAYVDRLIENARTIQILINTGTLTVGLLVGLIYVVGIITISAASAAAIWSGLGALVGLFVFDAAADAFEENRDQIICAIKDDSLAAFMESIIPPAAWSGWYKYADWQNATNTLWEGFNPQEGNLDPIRADSCPDCEEPVGPADYTFTFDEDNEGWTGLLVQAHGCCGQNAALTMQSDATTSTFEARCPNIKTLLGAGNYTVTRVEFDYFRESGGRPDQLRFQLFQNNGVVDAMDWIPTGPDAHQETHVYTGETSPTAQSLHFRFIIQRLEAVAGHRIHFMGEVRFWVSPF